MNNKSISAFGLFLTLIGVGFLVETLNLWDFSGWLSDWWPLLIILIGVIKWFNPGDSKDGAIFFIGLGLILQIWRLDLFSFSIWGLLWPLLLIGLGISFLRPRSFINSGHDNADKIESVVIFGGLEKKFTSTNFQGGRIVAIFGGAEIDLRDAKLKEDKIILEVTTIFGGTTLKVPKEWLVTLSGTPIFGGFEDKTEKTGLDEKSPHLTVRSTCLFGGTEISN